MKPNIICDRLALHVALIDVAWIAQKWFSQQQNSGTPSNSNQIKEWKPSSHDLDETHAIQVSQFGVPFLVRSFECELQESRLYRTPSGGVPVVPETILSSHLQSLKHSERQGILGTEKEGDIDTCQVWPRQIRYSGKRSWYFSVGNHPNLENSPCSTADFIKSVYLLSTACTLQSYLAPELCHHVLSANWSKLLGLVSGTGPWARHCNQFH